MPSGGSSGSTTTTTKSDPWEGQQPFLTSNYQNIANTFGLNTQQDGNGKITGVSGNINPNVIPDYYPGQTIATDSPETQAALKMRTDRSIMGSPLTSAAQNQLTSTLNGDYLNSNPYIDATYNKAAKGVTQNYNEIVNPGIDSAFSKAGRYGSGAYAQARNSADRSAGTALGDLATNIYGQNYANERQNQIQGQLYAPDLANQDYYDINQLSSVGDYKTNLAQQGIDQNIAKYNYNASKPLTALQTYQQMIQGDYGGTQTQQNPYTRNSSGGTLGTIAQGVGTVATLASLFSDARLKENIIPVGMENGHRTYEFNYKWSPHRYVGVMAQDILKTHPEAVMMTPIGYAVNYDMIGVTPRSIT